MRTLFKPMRSLLLTSLFRWTLALCASLSAASAADAQSAVDRPIRLVVGAPPGGSVDVVARALSELLAKELDQQVFVENKPGASGLIGMREVLNSAADGHTLMVGPSSLAVEIPATIKWPTQELANLRPVVEIARAGLILVTSARSDVKRFEDLKSALQTGTLPPAYASYSPGTFSHVLGWELTRLLGVSMTHIPYRGSPPALQELMGGSIGVMFDGPPSSLPLIQAGKLTALATTSSQRNRSLPHVPTLAELGMSSLTAEVSILLWASQATPSAVLSRIHDASARVAFSRTMQSKLEVLGLKSGVAADSLRIRAALQEEASAHREKLRQIGFQPEN